MKKKEYLFNNKKYVLMFTHSNILIEAAGVEKYISDQIDVLHSKNVYSIVVFPISNSAKMSGRLSKGYYGRDTFFIDLEKLPFEEMEKKYAADINVSFPRKAVRKIKRTIKKILRGGVPQIKQRTSADYGMLLTFKK